MTQQRNRIYEYIEAHPGDHFNELVRALDLAPGQVQYHVRKLRRRGDVVAESLYGRTHYFTPEYDEYERGAIAALRRETAREILVYLLDSGGTTPNTVATDLDIARSTLEWHLDHLVEQDLVEKQRDKRNHVTLMVVDSTTAVRLLDEITPSMSDRMIDRFTRLVDTFLADE
jgi:predicted transcriptional regulator